LYLFLLLNLLPDPVVIRDGIIVVEMPEHIIAPPLFIVIAPFPTKTPELNISFPEIITEPSNLQEKPPHVKFVEGAIDIILKFGDCEFVTIIFPVLFVDNEEVKFSEDEIMKSFELPIVTWPNKVVVELIIKAPII
jgi:hypothetical protein